jgi:Zn-dependent peptidase ImmA (M78 family)
MSAAIAESIAGLSQLQKMDQARKYIRTFQQSAPVDVGAIASDLGVKVWEIPDMPENISGKLFPDSKHGGSAGYSIGVNPRESYVRKRFTVAHEIAHFLLHRDQIRNGIQEDTFYRGGLSTQEEVEANKMAADILMPYHLIRQLSGQGIREIKELAKRFEVSEVAMKIRLNIPVT